MLEAFTDMDKDARYTGINNGIFMGTLTGPDIRVESMTFDEFKSNLGNKPDDTKRKLNEAGAKLSEAYKAYGRVKVKSSQ